MAGDARPQVPGRFRATVERVTVTDPPDAEMVFVADGTGIAPIRAIVEYVLARGGTRPVIVLHGTRRESELVYRDEFATWMETHRRLRWESVLAPHATGAG